MDYGHLVHTITTRGSCTGIFAYTFWKSIIYLRNLEKKSIFRRCICHKNKKIKIKKGYQVIDA